MKLIYQIRENDNVGTAIEALDQGKYEVWLENVGIVGNIHVASRVPQWFKVALKDVSEGQEVIKFGYSIGAASVKIWRGNIVHRGNIVFDSHEEIMLDPLVIEYRFEVGKSTKLIWKGQRIKAGENAAFESALVNRLGKEMGVAVTNIPAKNTLYCGNLLESDGYKLGPEQLKKMRGEYATLIKKMTDIDFKIFATEFYHIVKFYTMLKSDLFLREISRRKGR